MDDLAQGIDLSGDMPQNVDTSTDVVPAVSTSTDMPLEYNMVPQDTFVDPALVDAPDATNNVMPGGDAAASSTGTQGGGSDKTGQPGAQSFFANAFASFKSVATNGKISGVDVTRLLSSPTGNPGAQGNVPAANDQLALANKGLETANSVMDQVMGWGSALGFTQPVVKKQVQPKPTAKASNVLLYVLLGLGAVLVFAMAAR